MSYLTYARSIFPNIDDAASTIATDPLESVRKIGRAEFHDLSYTMFVCVEFKSVEWPPSS